MATPRATRASPSRTAAASSWSAPRRGEAIYRAALAAGAIAAEPVDPRAIDRMQPSQVRRKREIVARLAAVAATGRPVPRYRGVNLAAAARQAPLRQHLRSFAGLVRRILQRRA